MFYSRDKVEQLRQRYPEGTRICLDSMENDPRPIPSGTKGTVITVDDAGQLFMKWDNKILYCFLIRFYYIHIVFLQLQKTARNLPKSQKYVKNQ